MSTSRTVSAWVCPGPGQNLVKGEIQLPPLGFNDVEVKITATGICYSDVMILKAPVAYPGYVFPLVAGHEGVGVVTEVGPEVKHLKKGDRVGVGVYRNCCKICKHCLSGDNNVCVERKLTFMGGNSGTFAEYVRLDALHAVPIPESMSDADAGPLMCAGHTVFSPFRKHDIKMGDKVGIVGIGGLGHLAIQYANKLGCEVYAISSNSMKKNECDKLGAHHFINTEKNEELRKLAGTLNFILVTASGKNIDWESLVNALDSNGKLILIGAGHESFPISPFTLIPGQKSIVGSAAGSSSTLREMLSLSARHNIKPIIQTFSFNDINNAIALVKSGDVRYRAVLVHQ